MPLPSLSTPIGNTGISIDPSKAARMALLVAKGIERKPFGKGGASQDEIDEAMYGPKYGTGYEEWQAQPSGIVSDKANVVTGPTMPGTDNTDPSPQLWQMKANHALLGDEVKRGGRIKRDAGGQALKQAIGNFSQARNAEFDGSRAAPSSEERLLQAMLWPQQHQLAVAEPQQYRPNQPMAQNMGDLGDEIERGAKFLKGEPADDDNAPVKGQPAKGAVVNAATGHAPSGSPTVGSLSSYIYNRAQQIGVNPNLALGIALREGLTPKVVAAGGNPDSGGYSYGPFQLFSGGLAPAFHKDTGLDPRDPSTQYAQVDWALNWMKQHPNEISNNSRTWMSIKDNGGIGNLSKFGANYAAQNNYFKDAQPDQSVQSADNSNYMPPSMGRPDSQGIVKSPNQDGSFTLKDTSGNTVGYDRGAASLGDVPYSQPHMDQASPPLPPPRPSTSPPTQGEGASAGPQAQAQPMTDQSNLYDKLAFGPDVQAGYDNPQVMFDPNAAPSAARGGYLRRADGGPAYSSMPTNELIDKVLRIINRRKAAAGGTQSPAQSAIGNFILNHPQQALNMQNEDIALYQGMGMGGGQAAGRGSAGNSNESQAQQLLDATNGLWQQQLRDAAAGQQPTPSQPTPATPNTPAVPKGPLGNQGTPTGAGINDAPLSGPPSYDPASSSLTGPTSPIPMASPTGFNGYNYNNTLDQTLGTNNPTQNQIFGFNYPQNLPAPKPQPVGPVSQDEINGLYGFGGGYQMGTGTFQSGGAVIMDALNRARKAFKGKR